MTKEEKKKYILERYEEIKSDIENNEDEIGDIFGELVKTDIPLFITCWHEVVILNKELIAKSHRYSYTLIQDAIWHLDVEGIGWPSDNFYEWQKWYMELLGNKEVNEIIYGMSHYEEPESRLINVCIMDGNAELLKELLQLILNNKYWHKIYAKVYMDSFYETPIYDEDKKEISEVFEWFVEQLPTVEQRKKAKTKFIRRHMFTEE